MVYTIYRSRRDAVNARVAVTIKSGYDVIIRL
jgi:hypothetical protein